MRVANRLPLLTAVVLGLALGGPGRGQEPDDEGGAPHLVVQTGYSGRVHAVAFTPDGRRILTGGQDATRQWDATTGEGLEPIEALTDAAAFSRDGKRFVTGHRHLVRVWDFEARKVLHTYNGGTVALAISPDGQRVLASDGNQVQVWTVGSDKPPVQFRVPKDGAMSADFSPDGRRVVTGGRQTTAFLWSAETGEKIHALEGPRNGAVKQVAFSPDGKRVATGGAQTVQVWDADTGKPLYAPVTRTKGGPKMVVDALAFSPDGKRLLAGGGPTADVLDVETGNKLFPLKTNRPLALTSAAFSADGKRIVTGSAVATALVWDAQTGKELLPINRAGRARQVVAFSPDGTRILNCTTTGTPRVWDAGLGREVLRLEGHAAPVLTAAFSPDGLLIATAGADKTVKLWDARTGECEHTLSDFKHAVDVVAFSPDGKYLATDGDLSPRLWEMATRKVKEFHPPRGKKHNGITAAAFSADGKRLLTGGEGHLRVWNVETREEESVTFQGHGNRATSLAWSPDGKRVLAVAGGTIQLWDAHAGGKPLKHSFDQHGVVAAAFSPDGERLLTGGTGHAAMLWEVKTGKKELLPDHTGGVTWVDFSRDGRLIITGSKDMQARVWDAKTATRLCSLISFRDNTWAVVDPLGRYDASNGGDVAGLHWVINQEIVALTQLKERYYEPGLLAKCLGYNKEPIREVKKQVLDLKPAPAVAVQSLDPKKKELTLEVTDEGGGVGRVQVFVNGKEYKADAKPGAGGQLTIDLSKAPTLSGKGDEVRIVTWNADGDLAGRGLVREMDDEAAAAPPAPELYAIVAGISKYKNSRLDLTFAADDAEQTAQALEKAARRHFAGGDRVHITVLSSSGHKGTQPATRENFERAFEQARKARPGDVLLVFLAGHGVAPPGAADVYCYLTQDAASLNPQDYASADTRGAMAVSSDDLVEWIKQVPALKQVMVLDTCASGAAAGALARVSSSQVRAAERIKDRTGFHILMGCSADRVSYEAGRYEHGLLTYAVLEGMRGPGLELGELQADKLFRFAARRVPQLARGINGVQEPLVSSPSNDTIVVGKPLPDDIRLKEVGVSVSRPLATNPDTGDDNLKVAEALRLRLKEALAAGKGVTYVDEENVADAYRPTVVYTAEGGKIKARLKLRRNDETHDLPSIEGTVDDLRGLADRMVAEITKEVAGASAKP